MLSTWYVTVNLKKTPPLILFTFYIEHYNNKKNKNAIKKLHFFHNNRLFPTTFK